MTVELISAGINDSNVAAPSSGTGKVLLPRVTFTFFAVQFTSVTFTQCKRVLLLYATGKRSTLVPMTK